MVSLDEMRAENIAKAAAKGDYTSLLSSDYDKVKADTNGDGKLDKNEYNTYVISSNDLKLASETSMLKETNSKHYYYHIDNSLLLAIGLVCLTALLISIINRIKKTP